MRQNVKRDYNTIYDDAFWEKYSFLFEIACLLHDCGHAPFSHTLEFIYELQDETTFECKSSLQEQLEEVVNSVAFTKDSVQKGSPHEKMSALLVCTEFSDSIGHILSEKNMDNSDSIEFIVRAIIGAEYSGCDKISIQIKNCLIQLLNSSSIDVDKLDYIIRDANQAGIDSIAIDVERLLSSITLVETTELSNERLENQSISTDLINLELTDVEKFDFCGKITGDITIEEAEDVCINKGSLNVTGNLQTLNRVSVVGTQSEPSIININGLELDETISLKHPERATIIGKIQQPLQLRLNTAHFKYGSDFELNVRKCKKIHFTSAYVEANITGQCSGTMIGRIISDNSKYENMVRYKLGFHKSSLSVIQNVLSASNYEYQCVYSHHKVVYYSNYLIVEALHQCLSHYYPDESPAKSLAKILNWRNMVGFSKGGCKVSFPPTSNAFTFYRPTDYDILFLFRSTFLNCEIDSPVYSLLKEFYTRQFKTSLWKSYAEFKIFFSAFTDDEIQKVFTTLKNKSMQSVSDGSKPIYGKISDGELQRKLSEYGLKDVVWVDGKSQLRELKPENTYIRFKDCVRTYRSISSQNELTEKQRSLDVFYLYYNNSHEKDIDKAKVKMLFKELANE